MMTMPEEPMKSSDLSPKIVTEQHKSQLSNITMLLTDTQPREQENNYKIRHGTNMGRGRSLIVAPSNNSYRDPKKQR